MKRRCGPGVASVELDRAVFEIAPHFAETLAPVFETVLRGETVRNVDMQGVAAGEEAPHIWRAHFYPVRQTAGEVSAIGAICEDVTAAREAEAALALEKARLERLMISAPNVIYITDLKRRRNVYLNPQVLDSLGYAPAGQGTLSVALVYAVGSGALPYMAGTTTPKVGELKVALTVGKLSTVEVVAFDSSDVMVRWEDRPRLELRVMGDSQDQCPL